MAQPPKGQMKETTPEQPPHILQLPLLERRVTKAEMSDEALLQLYLHFCGLPLTGLGLKGLHLGTPNKKDAPWRKGEGVVRPRGYKYNQP